MNIQEIAANIGKTITDLVQTVLPDVPAEAIRYGGAALFAVLAFILLIFALRLLRSGRNISRPGKRVNIPRALQRDGIVVDLVDSPTDDNIAVRCVITSASSGKIHCEIIERLDVIKTREGKDITCIFPPMKTDDGKINALSAKLIQSDKSGRRADRIVLSAPTDYTLIPRRKHTRKRVADQQFIRVKLWMADPHASDISFEDAAPHVGVNSFATEGPDQSANAVVNISDGGLGLSILNRVIPETCTVGEPVAINLFMFNFKEKSFKPYWYSGQIRSMEEGRPGFTRMGIEFSGNGQVNENTGTLRWIKF